MANESFCSFGKDAWVVWEWLGVSWNVFWAIEVSMAAVVVFKLSSDFYIMKRTQKINVFLSVWHTNVPCP